MQHKPITADPDYFPCRDPAVTYEQKEARTCKGCVHIELVRGCGSLYRMCSKKRSYDLSRKCRLYLPDERAI